MVAFWRFASSLARRPTSEEHETAVDPVVHRDASRVSRRRLRGRMTDLSGKRARRSFSDDRGAKSPQAVPEDLENEADVELHHTVVHEVAILQESIARQEEVRERAEVDELCAEANAMIYHLDEMYGWEPGEPSIPDRMFSTNVRKLISDAHMKGHASIKLLAVVRAMRAVHNGPNAGTSAIAKAAAARNLVGGPSKDEAKLFRLQRLLRWDRYAEMVGIADQLDRSRERAIAKHLQIAEPMTHSDIAEARGSTRKVGMSHQVRDMDRGITR